MGKITIYFLGICTHMRFIDSELPGMNRRVVLVNGRIPREIRGMWVPSHNPMLRIAAGDLVVNGQRGKPEESIIEWNLEGTHVEVANGIGEVTYDAAYDCCIPHLGLLNSDLPPPSKEVVLDAHHDKASCYFDVSSGQFTAGYLASGAATAVLHVTTEQEPILRLRKFRESAFQDFHLRDGAEIALTNLGTTKDDDDANDFLLHYETAEFVPLHPGVPGGIPTCCQKLAPSYIIPGGLSVGPGCSNSDFP